MEAHETICIYCANACNSGCSWSESLTPVEGWTVIENKTGPRVIACPKFEIEKRRTTTFDREGMLALAEAMAIQLNDDYVHGTRAIRRVIENEIRSSGVQKLLHLSDPESVIRTLRAIAKEHDEEMEAKVNV